MTNYEAIVGSDIDTLAELLNDMVDRSTCPARNIVCDKVECIKAWLKQETGESSRALLTIEKRG